MEANRGELQDQATPTTSSRSGQRRVRRGSGASADLSQQNRAAVPADADAISQACVQSTISSSSCGDGEGRVMEQARPSHGVCQGCEDVLHELSGVITGVLLNAQLLGWKLPPYSHLKRPVHEMERNAQRGGELLRRLLQHCNGKA